MDNRLPDVGRGGPEDNGGLVQGQVDPMEGTVTSPSDKLGNMRYREMGLGLLGGNPDGVTTGHLQNSV